MTELSKLLPVVFATVQLTVLLIVPVGQVVTAHRAPKSTSKKVLVTFVENKGMKQRRRRKRLGAFFQL